VSSRELHVQLLGKSRGGLPSFADLTRGPRAPRPDPAGDGEQAAALRNMSLCYSALFPCRPVSLDLFLSSSTCLIHGSNKSENQKEQKDKDFMGFSIDTNLVRNADKDAIILHCLPAYRAKEITDEVFECEKSRIFEQAENRMHAQQALLSCLL